VTGSHDNRVTLSATPPQALNAGALDKEVFEDKPALVARFDAEHVLPFRHEPTNT